MLAGRGHGLGRVDEQAGVVVRPRVGDAAGQESRGTGGARVAGIRGVGAAPSAALAAGVHDEVGVAGAAPGQPLEGVAAPASIADVLDHERAVRRALVRQQQPAFDGVARIAGERHVDDVGVLDLGLRGREHRPGVGGGRGGQFAGPELVEVRGFLYGRPVPAQFVQGKVAEHSGPRGRSVWGEQRDLRMQHPVEADLPALAGESVSQRRLDIRARPAHPQLHLAGVHLPAARPPGV